MEELNNALLQLKDDAIDSIESASSRLLDDLEDFRSSRSESRDSARNRVEENLPFRAADYAPLDPFTPNPDIPVRDEAEHNRNMSVIMGQRMSLTEAKEIAANHKLAHQTEGQYLEASVQSGKNRVLLERAVGEYLKLEQEYEVNRLTDSKTANVITERGMHDVQVSYKTSLVEAEGFKGAELVNIAVRNIQRIRAESDKAFLAFEAKHVGVGQNQLPITQL